MKRSTFPGSGFIQVFDVQYWVVDDGSVYADVTFTTQHEGPPDHVHGGAIATVLDELMGVAAYEAGRIGKTATMTFNYRASIPLNVPIHLQARVDLIEGRKTYVSCEALLPDGKTAIDGTALFIYIEGFKELLQQYADKRHSQT